MSWLVFIAEMTKALAWPLVALVALVVYRNPLLGLVRRLRSFKYREAEAVFDEQAVRVAESIAVIPQRSLAAVSDQVDEHLFELAQLSPRAAVVEVWARIEARLRDMLPPQAAVAQPRTAHEMIKVLREADLINHATETALRGLMQLRNLAVHSHEDELSAQKALDFITLANAVLWVLRAPSVPN